MCINEEYKFHYTYVSENPMLVNILRSFGLLKNHKV